MPRIHRSRLLEHVEVTDAEFIGNARGYDLFRILTYNAAQEFVVHNNNQAGAYYTHDERTFNHNINDNQRLYFFTEEDTNIVKCAIVKSSGTHRDATFHNEDGSYEVTLRCNFDVEDEEYHAEIPYNLPLFLLDFQSSPISIRNSGGFGITVIGGQLVAVLGCVLGDDNLNIGSLVIGPDSEITSVNPNAFTFGASATSIVIDKAGVTCPNELPNVGNVVRNVNDEPEQETIEIEDDTTNDDEIEVVDDEDISDAEASEEEVQATPTETPQEPQEITYPFIYRVVGNEIHIVRAKKHIARIEIPDEIDGKPVTVIEAYAFSGMPDLTHVRLPKNLKRIERGAFLNTPYLDYDARNEIKKIKELGKVQIGKDII